MGVLTIAKRQAVNGTFLSETLSDFLWMQIVFSFQSHHFSLEVLHFLLRKLLLWVSLAPFSSYSIVSLEIQNAEYEFARQSHMQTMDLFQIILANERSVVSIVSDPIQCQPWLNVAESSPRALIAFVCSSALKW